MKEILKLLLDTVMYILMFGSLAILLCAAIATIFQYFILLVPTIVVFIVALRYFNKGNGKK